MKLINHTNKEGSYIVEATITLPIFLIAMIVMCSIISIYSCIEDANYISANNLRRAAVEALVKKADASTPIRIKSQLSKEHSQIKNLHLFSYQYRKEKFCNDEIIAIDADLNLNSKNPLGLMSLATYRMRTVTRAYVGKIRDVSPMSSEKFASNDVGVYIFPQNGEKYHNKSCSFLYSKCRGVVLTAAVKHKYEACPVCKSKKILNGNVVYIYPDYGTCYHMKNCHVLERNYVEIAKDVAERRGYIPCNKCGG